MSKKIDTSTKIEVRRLTTMTVLAAIMVVFGIVLVGVSFVLPPSGEIHPTVLTAFGEALTFSGSLLGIENNYKFKVFRERHSRDAENIQEEEELQE